jgi:hypothetical protein
VTKLLFASPSRSLNYSIPMTSMVVGCADRIGNGRAGSTEHDSGTHFTWSADNEKFRAHVHKDLTTHAS